MKVINDGQAVQVTADYEEIAMVVEAIRSAIVHYNAQGQAEKVAELTDLLDKLLNRQEVAKS